MRHLFLLLACLLVVAPRVLAQEAKPESTVEKIRLQRTDTDWMMKLLLPNRAIQGLGGADRKSSLIPDGIQGVLAFPIENSLLVRATTLEKTRQFKDLVQFLDISHTERDGQTTISIKLKRARPERVREDVLKLPEAGKVELVDGSLKLAGSTSWVRDALRTMARLEIASARPD